MGASPKAPASLGPAGRATWRTLVARFDFEPHERLLLAALCKQADEIEALEALVRADGFVTAGSRGQSRVNGAVTELRLCRCALIKLYESLNLPSTDDESKPTTVRSRAAKARAERRWKEGA